MGVPEVWILSSPLIVIPYFKVWRRHKEFQEDQDFLIHLINDNAVCKTTLATQGLLLIYLFTYLFIYLFIYLLIYVATCQALDGLSWELVTC